MNHTDISNPVAKAVSAITAATVSSTNVVGQVAESAAAGASYSTWALVNAIPWSTIASIVATLYTSLLTAEWAWKKVWRPFFVRRGWVKPLRHRIISVEEYEQGDTDRAAL
jgi:hypothetical protein